MNERIKNIAAKIKKHPALARAVSDRIARPDPLREQDILDLANQVLSMQDACTITGLTDKTLRKELKEGRITGVLVGGQGGRWLIPRPALTDWLKLKGIGYNSGT